MVKLGAAGYITLLMCVVPGITGRASPAAFLSLVHSAISNCNLLVSKGCGPASNIVAVSFTNALATIILTCSKLM